MTRAPSKYHRLVACTVTLAAVLGGSCSTPIVVSDTPCRGCQSELQENNDLPTDTLFYSLPVGKVTVAVDFVEKKMDKDGIIVTTPQKLSLTVSKLKYIPDPDPRYTFKVLYSHRATSDDFVSMEVDPGTRLMKKVATISKDRTADILVGVNAFLDKLATVSSESSKPLRGAAGAPTCKEFGLHSFHVEEDIDITDDDEISSFERKVNRVVKQILGIEENTECYYFAMRRRDTPYDVSEDIAASGRSNNLSECNRGICFRLPRSVRVDLAIFSAEHNIGSKPVFLRERFGALDSYSIQDKYLQLTQSTSPQGIVAEKADTPSGGADQSLIAKTTTADAVAISARYYVPDRRYVGMLNFNRHAFVENKVTAEFDNGMLKKLEATDPSEVQGFISIPTQLLQIAITGTKL